MKTKIISLIIFALVITPSCEKRKDPQKTGMENHQILSDKGTRSGNFILNIYYIQETGEFQIEHANLEKVTFTLYDLHHNWIEELTVSSIEPTTTWIKVPNPYQKYYLNINSPVIVNEFCSQQ